MTNYSDPVFVHKTNTPIQEGGANDLPGWYFWDETWADYHGPFATELEARESLKNYCETL